MFYELQFVAVSIVLSSGNSAVLGAGDVDTHVSDDACETGVPAGGLAVFLRLLESGLPRPYRVLRADYMGLRLLYGR